MTAINNGFNATKAEAFGGRMLTMLNESSLSIMASIGFQTGLFEVLAGLPPATSGQIAEAAGLHERYVREWLAAMTVGQIVEHDPQAHSYWLPPEHSSWLTEAAGADNMARYMQYIGLMGEAEEKIIGCFHNGGGLPYEAYPRFQKVMADESYYTVVAVLVDQILPLVPGLLERLEAGIDVLDVGCGRGGALLEMARAFPNSHFTGYDISEEGISAGRRQAAASGLENVRFQLQDAALVDVAGQFDLVTAFDAIHDQAFPARVLANIQRALRLGGTFLMQDIAGSSCVHNNYDHPTAPLLYVISTMHCMPVSLSAGGAGLGTMWGQEKALEMLAQAGFEPVQVEQLPHDIFSDYYICQNQAVQQGV